MPEKPANFKSFRKKVDGHQLIITKADKSNALVTLNEADNNEKVNNFLSSDNINVLPNDPTNMVNNQLKSKLKTTLLLREPNLLLNMNPHTPPHPGYCQNSQGYRGIHNNEVPICPVVSTCSGPMYKTEKFLVKVFKNHVNWKAKKPIKNSIELAEQLRDMELPDSAKLISLDVDNMCANVDRNKAIILSNQILKKHSYISQSETEQFLDITEPVVEKNYFRFGNKFYLMSEVQLWAPMRCHFYRTFSWINMTT